MQPVIDELRVLLRDWAQHTDTALVTLTQDILRHYGCWDDDDADAAAARRATFNEEVKGDDRAYDGWSAEPQKRDLTARERDILCRMLSQALRPVREMGGTDTVLGSMLQGYEARVTVDGSEVEQLQMMRFVINPRDDVG